MKSTPSFSSGASAGQQLKPFPRGLRNGRAWAALVITALLFGACTPSDDTQNSIIPGKPASAAAGPVFPNWYENKPGYDRALADAKKTGKPMLVYIYATWCPHCKTFSKNILTNPKVQQMLLRYPHVRIAPEHGPAEERIQEEYAIPGYPSFYVVRDGAPPVMISTYTDTRPKKPEEFIQSVLEVAEKGK